ncbi:S1 family peptidase [Streptomyces sp. SID3343]|uniref:S1 family peptidase n=1 Tax=Streptomyces sp. SID3343 TaxID=2690260 RepID=UPI0013704B0F|nr:S1 family peptidase [Streptomyces sp. SID3343]MYW01164.1 hypothetical protein [Streptomyces sp. SID3343]MYW04156.1 hypothetical protein [Streptomyces sp. SID3343]
MKRLVAAVAALGALAVIPFSAAADEPGPLSAETLATMTPEAQGRLLEPLRAAADGAISVGQEQYADIFTSAEMSADYTTLHVYLTDTSQADVFIRQVHAKYPKINTKLLDVKQGKNSQAAMKSEALRYVANESLPFKVYSAAFAVDGGGVTLSVDKPSSASGFLASRESLDKTAVALEIRVEQGSEGRLLATRENDSAPFYAGAALDWIDADRANCTSGMPSISTWDGRQWLVTAGHCYPVGQHVWTHGGTYVGQVKDKRPDIDAAFIETTTRANTWDGTDAAGYARALNGVRHTAVGDMVCNLGYNIKVMCNIRTAGVNVWSAGDVGVMGMVGGQVDGYLAAVGGDSGGPIITVNDPNSRQLNGMVSIGFYCDDIKRCRSVGWISAATIQDVFAVRLNFA